jgi:hypothetical protein
MYIIKIELPVTYNRKLSLVKAIQAITGLSLIKSKNIVDSIYKDSNTNIHLRLPLYYSPNSIDLWFEESVTLPLRITEDFSPINLLVKLQDFFYKEASIYTIRLFKEEKDSKTGHSIYREIICTPSEEVLEEEYDTTENNLFTFKSK